MQQRVEILKALYREARILVLDEPTAVLTPQEVEDLFKVMRQLTDRGVSIIFITHKLKEVLAIADEITVMRRGKVVGNTTPSETDEQGLGAAPIVASVERHRRNGIPARQTHPFRHERRVPRRNEPVARGVGAARTRNRGARTGGPARPHAGLATALPIGVEPGVHAARGAGT